MKKREIFSILLSFLFLTNGAFAQKSSAFSLEGYVDSYYASYNRNDGTFQRFSTVGARDKTLGVNIAQLAFTYKSKNVRSSLTAHTGDIQRATWSSAFPFIQEANVGIHLFPGWWLDAGFFTTHIGTESFLPKNNQLSTTSIITYNEPFFQSGAKLAYEGNDKFDLEFWLINGYNQFVDNNSAKSYGMLFSYNFTDNISMTYTNLFGRESQDNSQVPNFVTYQNIYTNIETKIFDITLGLDVGTIDYNGLSSAERNYLYGFLATVRTKITDKLSITARYESLTDEDGFIVGVYPTDVGVNGIDMYGITGGIEYAPSENSYLRFETRLLSNRDENLRVFGAENTYNRQEFLFTVGSSFKKEW